MTKKEILEEVQKVANKYIDDEFLKNKTESLSSALKEPPYKPIIEFPLLINGHYTSQCYCHNCETMFVSKGSPCPNNNCTNHHTYSRCQAGNLLSSRRDVTLIEECNDDYIIGVICDMLYKHDAAGIPANEFRADSKFEFLKGKFIPVIHPNYIWVFSKKFGLLVSHIMVMREVKFVKKNSAPYKTASRRIVNSDIVPKEKEEMSTSIIRSWLDTSDDEDSLSLCMRKYIIKLEEKSNPNKEQKKYELPTNLESFSLADIKKRLGDKHLLQPLVMIFNQTVTGDEYHVSCNKCNKIFSITAKDNSCHCPSCGNEIRFHSACYPNNNNQICNIDDFSLIGNSQDGGIIVRPYRFVETLGIKEDGSLYTDMKVETKEFAYSLDGKKGFRRSKCLDNAGNSWSSMRKIKYDSNIMYGLLNTPEEFRDIVSKSNLSHKGILEAYGLVDSPWKVIDNFDNFDNCSFLYTVPYILAVTNLPAIEQIYKAGLYAAATELLNFYNAKCYIDSFINTSATNVCEILHINKPILKMAAEGDLQLQSIYKLKDLWNIDNSVDLDTFNKIQSFGLNIEIVKQIVKTYHISFVKQCEYLNDCVRSQCIPAYQALTIWRDYLFMGSKLKYRFKNKSIKFPKSLKLEHDKVQFAFKSLEQELNRKKFDDQMKKNKGLEYNNEDYSVICPTTAEDIIAEGNALHHCVASYVDYVTEGETSILFLRQNSDMDSPFYTLEVKDNQLLQAKGLCNMLPTSEIINFLNEWVSVKNIESDGRY